MRRKVFKPNKSVAFARWQQAAGLLCPAPQLVKHYDQCRHSLVLICGDGVGMGTDVVGTGWGMGTVGDFTF